jgi:hypothetical protein
MGIVYTTKVEPKKKPPDVTLITSNAKTQLFINVLKFPVLCPSCNQYSPNLFSHSGSHYGNVGSINCQCGEELKLTDSDNIIDFINIRSSTKTVKLDFYNLYHLTQVDFETIKSKYDFDVYKKYLNKQVSLENLIEHIEKVANIKITPIESDIILPESVKKWIALVKH